MTYAPAFPKTQNGKSRTDERFERRAAADRAERACYQHVDRRDGRCCRVCGRHVVPGAVDGRERAEHHHLTKRSQGGQHTPENVATLCARCHAEIHVRGLLRLSGDAEARNPDGRLCGLTIERLTEAGWKVQR